jgi:hypothetical protein
VDPDFDLIGFCYWNSNLEPLLEGLFAQIHIDLSLNKTSDCTRPSELSNADDSVYQMVLNKRSGKYEKRH